MADVAQPPGPHASIARKFESRIRGEVRFGRHDRMLYATDASIYQVEPLGVVVPASIEDARVAVALCGELGIPVLPRGGGTSLAGQAVGPAVILDLSVHCGGPASIDTGGHT